MRGGERDLDGRERYGRSGRGQRHFFQRKRLRRTWEGLSDRIGRFLLQA
jgi:hypothetical protein